MIFEQDLHFTYFLLCFAFGYLFGSLSFALDGFLVLPAGSVVKQVLTAIRLLLLCFFFIFMKNKYDLGQIRWYMPLTCLIGFYAYLKTIGKIIAKFIKKVYNVIVNVLIKGIKRINDLGKIAKNNCSGNRFCRFIAFHFNRHNGLPNGNHKRKTRQGGRVKGGNCAS
jgi:hypothetical protein